MLILTTNHGNQQGDDQADGLVLIGTMVMIICIIMVIHIIVVTHITMTNMTETASKDTMTPASLVTTKEDANTVLNTTTVLPNVGFENLHSVGNVEITATNKSSVWNSLADRPLARNAQAKATPLCSQNLQILERNSTKV